MKRFIFSAIALMVAATACTESGLIDTPDMYGSAIVFDTYIGKTPITKAENIDLSYLESTAPNGGARVYAFMCEKGDRNPDFTSAYMDGRIVCKTPTTYKGDGTIETYGEWKYEAADENNTTWTEEEVYWPGDVDLAFAAYNLKVVGTTYMTNISSDNTKFDFIVADKVAKQVDLLVTPLTFVSESPNSDTSVPLNFIHLLSRVGFKVLATESTTAVIQISSIKLNGSFPKKGHVDLTLATATNATSTTPVITPIVDGDNAYQHLYRLFEDGESFSIVSSNCAQGTQDNPGPGAQPIYGNTAADRYMMIMPGKQANASIEISYRLTGETKDRYASIELGPDWEFQAGYAYEFIFKISTAAIEFEAEIGQNWNPQNDTDIPQEN